MESTPNSSAGGTVRPYVYREGIGQDPAVVAMNADVYGWPVQWPAKTKAFQPDPLGSFFFTALAILWMLISWALVEKRCRRVAMAVTALVALMMAVVGNAQVSATPTGTPNEYLIEWAARSGGESWNSVYTSGPSDSPPYVDLAGPGTNWAAGSATVSVTEGMPYIEVRFNTPPPQGNLITIGPWSDAPSYEITFTIPANPHDRHVTYQFVQNGENVGSYQQEPGASVALYQITGLESNDPVVMMEVEVVREWIEDPLNPGTYIEGSVTVTNIAPVASGTPAETGPTIDAPPAPKPPANNVPTPAPTPATPAPPVSAPTAAPPVTGPTPFATPFGSTETSDTTGAKTQDIANAANAIVEALSTTATAAATNANGIITAVNTAATSATTNANGMIDAVNANATATVSGLAAVVTALNALKAQNVAIAQSESSAGGTSAPAGLTDPSTQTAVWDGGGFNPETKFGTLIPTAPTIITSVSPVTTFTIEFAVPVPHGADIEVSHDINFAAAPFAAPIAIFRGICNVFVTLGFYLLTFYTVRGAFTTAK